MSERRRYPQELRERAVRLVREHRDEYPSEWAAITSIAGKLGVGTEALRLWLRRAQAEQLPSGASAEKERIRELERENRELRRANEILKAAAAFFAAGARPALAEAVSFIQAHTARWGVEADLPGAAGRAQ